MTYIISFIAILCASKWSGCISDPIFILGYAVGKVVAYVLTI